LLPVQAVVEELVEDVAVEDLSPLLLMALLQQQQLVAESSSVAASKRFVTVVVGRMWQN